MSPHELLAALRREGHEPQAREGGTRLAVLTPPGRPLTEAERALVREHHEGLLEQLADEEAAARRELFRETPKEKPAREHHCHAKGCAAHCPPEHLMCLAHWRLVPPKLQQAVWAHYRKGQTEDMNVSGEWLVAARLAICAVAVAEGLQTAEQAEAEIARTRKAVGDE